MKQLLVAAAIIALAATGCVSSQQFAKNKHAGPASLADRAQAGSEIIQTSFLDGGLMGKHKKSCDPCCGECECGCAEDCCCACDTCCDAECGCPTECCDPCCGCEDPCCGGSCDDRGCFGKLIDRIASGGCKNDNCNGGGGGCPCKPANTCGFGGNGGHCGCGPMCQACAFHESCLCPHAGGYPANTRFNPGPPVGQVAYPYYTTRGPRDFLLNNPPTIGPY